MKYIECPATFDKGNKVLFLAGGISGCSNWQKEVSSFLSNEEFVLLNPRRANFNSEDKSLEEAQITWEYNHLELADVVSFWFPKETLCPITLFELGKIAASKKKIFVGVDPNYKRKRDIEIQLKLIRPEINVVYSLSDLVFQIKKWIRG